MPTELGEGQQVQFPEPAYSLGPGSQGDYHSTILRLGYTSLTTPSTTIDYNMRTGDRWVQQCLFRSLCCVRLLGLLSETR